MPAPLDPAKREAIEEAIRAGELSRNAIARQHHVAQGTVSRIARRLEHDGEPPAFDRAKVAAATHARTEDMASRRAALAEALLSDAERIRAQLWQQCKWGNFGGKENTYAEVELDKPRFTDQSTILGAVEKAVRTHATLTGEGEGSEREATLLEQLAGDAS